MAVGSREQIDVEIHDLSGAGSGVGRLPDGRVVFVPRTAPGDQIRVQLTRQKNRFAQGVLSGLVVASPKRRTPECAVYDRCGGCQIQHLRYQDQIEWKGVRITETLRRVGGIELTEPLIVEPAPDEWFYRNRVRFSLKRIADRSDDAEAHDAADDSIPVRTRPPRVLAGFHELDRPNRIVDLTDECRLPEAGILEVWGELRKRWGPGAIRLPDGNELALTLRTAVDGVVLVIEGGSSRSQRGRRDSEALVDEIDGLLAIWHRPASSDVLDLIAGAGDRTDTWFGEPVPVGSKAFLQVNRALGETLHLEVLKEMGNPQRMRVIDAYCGVGAYGRRLARHGAIAIGIESDLDAVEAARRESPPGWSVEAGRVEEVLPRLDTPERLILNPPRAGVDEAVTRLLVERPVSRIVYVSCDPATLARDLKRLGDSYAVVRAKGYDLFPQTAHVETVVTLEHRSAGSSNRNEEQD